jgi:hypothetical protein
MQTLYIPPPELWRILRAQGCNTNTGLKMAKVSSLEDTPHLYRRVTEKSIIHKEYKKKCLRI